VIIDSFHLLELLCLHHLFMFWRLSRRCGALLCLLTVDLNETVKLGSLHLEKPTSMNLLLEATAAAASECTWLTPRVMMIKRSWEELESWENFISKNRIAASTQLQVCRDIYVVTTRRMAKHWMERAAEFLLPWSHFHSKIHTYAHKYATIS
jgi:hypothetical protein